MIRNKVTESGVLTIDLTDFCNTGPRKSIDLVSWLKNDFIIKEKDFRVQLGLLEVNDFKDCFVNVFCSSNAIIPMGLHANSVKNTKRRCRCFFGKPDAFELYLFQKKLQLINFEKYKNKRVFIKSCKNKNLPIGAFSIICKKLIPHVKVYFTESPALAFL